MFSNYNFLDKTKNLSCTRKYKILVVDDDVYSSSVLKIILGDKGYDVTVCNNSMECVSKCMKENYDIIFMDFHMELLDGADLTDVIKNTCNNKSIIFAFTGDSSKSAFSKFKNSNMIGALIKPVDIGTIERLMTIVENKIIKNESFNNLNNLNNLNNMFSNNMIFF